MDSSLKINNRRVSYSDVGEGKVIVFLHGWMDSKKAYEKITEILSKKYRCICIDLPGFGKSDYIKDVRVEKISTIIHKVIKKLRINNFYLVGHSLGGAISIVYASKHQERIEKIVLISPFVKYTQFPKLTFYSVRYLAPYLVDKKIISPIFKLVKAVNKTIIDKKIDVDYIKNLRKEKVKNKAINALKYAYQLNSLDLYSYLRRIRKNVLIVYGTKDSLLSIKPLEPLFGVLNNIHLAIYEDVRHYIFSYNAEDLSKKIDLFFESNTVQ